MELNENIDPQEQEQEQEPLPEEQEQADIEEQEEELEADKTRETFRKFMDVQQLMGVLHHRRMKVDGPTADATRGRGRILALLKLKDGVATKDMAQVLGIRVSSLNEALAKLEKDGLVERIASESDKRVMLVSLTEAGREAKAPAEHLPDILFDDFADEELDAFGGFLDRITANLEGELGEDAQALLEKHRAARKAFMEESQGRDGHGHEHHDHDRRDHDRRDHDRGGRDDRGPRGGGKFGSYGGPNRGGRGGYGHGGRDDRGGRGGYGGPRRDDRGGRGGYRGRDDRGGRDRW